MSSVSKNLRVRSRFGCNSCKQKRIKCDEKRPSCSSCVNRGTKCQYQVQLHFREDMENQGKKFGREGVWRKNSSQPNTVSLLERSKNAHYLDIRNQENLLFVDYGLDPFTSVPKSVPSSIIPPEIPMVYGDGILSYALSYYVDFVSPIFNPVNIRSDMLVKDRRLIRQNIKVEKGLDLSSLLQYSQQKVHVFYLILSLGSIYLSRRKDIPNVKEWFTKSKNFQQAGLSMIMDALNNISAATTDTLICLMLLVMYEVADNCNSEWVTYLKCCKEVISSPHFVQPKNDLEKSLHKFALEYLDYYESMGRTACKDTNSFFVSNDDVDDNGCSISWIGCDKKLVGIISDITDLSLERTNRNLTVENYHNLCAGVSSRIDGIDLHINLDEALVDIGYNFVDLKIDSSIAQSDMIFLAEGVDEEEFCFLLACEVKRLATQLYLDCCLLNLTPEDEKIRLSVNKILKMLKFVILKHEYSWSSNLLWSIFIASVEISLLDETSEDNRYVVLQLLNKMESYSLGNLDYTRKVILQVWKKRDLSNSDENSFGSVRKPKKGAHPDLYSQNDWELFVADRSYHISLG